MNANEDQKMNENKVHRTFTTPSPIHPFHSDVILNEARTHVSAQ
jgi:hypothetical protein